MDDDIFIAMPVYRGAEFIGETVRSIREQTYSRFHVVMSVDGADDPTIELCRSFTDDPRFELFVQPTRRGWFGNFAWLTRRCDRKYFCYWQQDDLASTGYLGSLRNQLLIDPEASIAHTDIQWFGSQFHRDSVDGVFGTPLERVLQRLESIHYGPLRGLVRSSALPTMDAPVWTNSTGLDQSEFVFLAELAARGSFHRVTSAMYFKRAHPAAATDAWVALEPHLRRIDWIDMGIGILKVALPLTTVEDHRRLLATVLDRLAVKRAGRGFSYVPEQTGPAVADFVGDFMDQAAVRLPDLPLSDLAGGEWELAPGSGFERPIHPWIIAALKAEAERCRALRDLTTGVANDESVELSVADGGKGLITLRSGWSTPEPWGVWTEGPVATISLPPGSHRRVALHGAAFVPNEPIRVGCAVDGSPVTFSEVPDANLVTLSIDLPGGPTHKASILQLYLPDASSPADAGGSTDERMLGFGLHRIVLYR